MYVASAIGEGEKVKAKWRTIISFWKHIFGASSEKWLELAASVSVDVWKSTSVGSRRNSWPSNQQERVDSAFIQRFTYTFILDGYYL